MKIKFLTSVLLVLSILSPLGWSEVDAKSSGGRSGGGSFRSSPSRSNTTRSNPAPSQSNSVPSRTYQQGGNNTIVPIFIPGANNNPNNYSNNSNNYRSSSSSSDGSWVIGLMVILGIGGLALIIYLVARKFQAGNAIGNDKVTVTKLQVALLAEARAIQGELDEISLQADTDTPEGLATLLQEAAIALLRTPENWSHVLSSSQSVKQDQAEQIFNSLSVTERRKFSAETLVNVGGNTRRNQSFQPNPEDDPAAYIVVTLLIGTEHDRPLFGAVKSRQDLETALETIAAIPASHLLIFELLWSPQVQGDSLSYDELLTEYTDMQQI